MEDKFSRKVRRETALAVELTNSVFLAMSGFAAAAPAKMTEYGWHVVAGYLIVWACFVAFWKALEKLTLLAHSKKPAQQQTA